MRLPRKLKKKYKKNIWKAYTWISDRLRETEEVKKQMFYDLIAYGQCDSRDFSLRQSHLK